MKLNGYFFVLSLVLVNLMGFSGHADPLPLPKYGPAGSPLATPLSIDSTYFRNAAHLAPDFWALIPYYTGQNNSRSCSVASVAMVLNAFRRHLPLTSDDQLITQSGLLSRVRAETWAARVGARGHGTSLDVLGNIVRAALVTYGFPSATVEVVHLNDLSPENRTRLHSALLENESSAENFMILNFLQGAYTNDAQVGHIAPVGAYDEEHHRVLVMDPDREWYEPYWVSEETLMSGLSTIDAGAHAFRGFVFIRLNQTPAAMPATPPAAPAPR